jgi:hypothetical protein
MLCALLISPMLVTRLAQPILLELMAPIMFIRIWGSHGGEFEYGFIICSLRQMLPYGCLLASSAVQSGEGYRRFRGPCCLCHYWLVKFTRIHGATTQKTTIR